MDHHRVMGVVAGQIRGGVGRLDMRVGVGVIVHRVVLVTVIVVVVVVRMTMVVMRVSVGMIAMRVVMDVGMIAMRVSVSVAVAMVVSMAVAVTVTVTVTMVVDMAVVVTMVVMSMMMVMRMPGVHIHMLAFACDLHSELPRDQAATQRLARLDIGPCANQWRALLPCETRHFLAFGIRGFMTQFNVHSDNERRGLGALLHRHDTRQSRASLGAGTRLGIRERRKRQLPDLDRRNPSHGRVVLHNVEAPMELRDLGELGGWCGLQQHLAQGRQGARCNVHHAGALQTS